MDPSNSAQDIVRCDLCEVIAQKYCDFCHVNLCIPCTGKHISDDYDEHKVVPFEQRESTLVYPKCTTHETKRCKYHCKECNISVCSLCSVISNTHRGHTISTLFDIYNAKREVVRKDTDELENISSTYEEVASDIEARLDNIDGEYEKLSTAVTKHGEDCHRIINTIVNKMKADIIEMKIEHMSILRKQLDEIKQIQLRIEEQLFSLNRIQESNEVSMTMEYISENKGFVKLPPQVQVPLPTFNPKAIDTYQFYTLFGYLTPLSTTTEENVYTLKKPETSSGELLEEAELITTLNTGYQNLCGVTCFDEEEIWTRATQISDIKCFNIQGSIIKSIKTKSGEQAKDVAVTGDGDIVYSDWKTRTVNKVKNGQTEELIRLQNWAPSKLCVTSSGDLLVIIYSDDKTQVKVVRYSGSTEKQTIQFDEEGKPMYSGNRNVMYITENRNLDICVADCGAGAVVVVNRSGNLRFKYTGHPEQKRPFDPYGITTDSKSHILTTDCNNHCIHILNHDGQFLHSIYNCDLKDPFGLHVDKSDNLFNMDPSNSAQDVVRCDLCEDAIIANLDSNYEKLTAAVTKHGEECKRVINTIVDKMKADIEEIKIKHISILKKHLDEIKQIQHSIKETLLNLNRIEESNEVFMTMEYISKNTEFRRLPPKVQVSLPTFRPKTIDTDQFGKSFGSLAALSTTREEEGYRLKKPVSATKELLGEPELITTINTGSEKLLSVICFGEDEIWTRSRNVSDMKCFNMQGSLIKSIKTKSEKYPYDIAVAIDRGLLYSDWKTRSVNKVKNGQTEEVITLQDWVPSQLCVTSSGDLLVTMYSDDKTQAKAVRYSGSTVKQIIQFDEDGRPLYSGNNKIKYITENRNLDICVADCGTGAVVVVNQTGKLRFRYTGHPCATKNKPFEPYGITTDSQSQILTADGDNNCIHILDQDGVFLRYIDNCDLKGPYGLYIDKSDSLYVAECFSGNVKKIKYMK
ncbi:uncharacterized protein LOC133187512 [Saccostrea echinata]|uniref:uncharacterized protein LOC133187512 n=1 Tax=Saccostrea echinata TaxID=191078 RepID=UPI002A819F25|nr:uncharacterized protein LOC133187512 [Saccostrea echinata]